MTEPTAVPPLSGDRPVRHCLVTGANRGLGLEFVRQLLARGDRVVATCRQPGRAHALNQLAGEHPARLHVLPLDIAVPRSHEALARDLPLVTAGQASVDTDTDAGSTGENRAASGAGQIDLLINNAGVLHAGERFGAVSAANLDDSLRTNAAGPFLLTQALASQLADGARVANLSSTMGSVARVETFRSPSYAISKAALNMASVLLGQALAGRGIVVLALHPGWVRTEMGGASAPLAATEAVAGLLTVIDRATVDDSGRFFDWQGQPVPW